MAKKNVIWTAWNAEGVIAEVKGATIENMGMACELVMEDMKRCAPKATGRLRESIDYEIVEESDGSITGLVGVRHGFQRTYIARFLEFGTQKMAARPFMRPALLENLNKIREILRGKR
ncbi:MAG TPA: HK97-gp10 family putative phage morphogenesis protein [Anaerolineae bacterium]|nr:HK97-gp10 family putative phage morphogenesis protein [Anaerolineae bacterium]